MSRQRNRHLIAALAFSGACGVAVAAQPNPALTREHEAHLAKLSAALDGLGASPSAAEVERALDPRVRELLYLLVISGTRPAPLAPLAEREAARLDKQVGGAGSNAGTTSLVSKGSVPAVLGLAVENGALTRSVSGTTITFQGRPLGLLQALSGRPYADSYPAPGAEAFLQRFAFSASFDANRGAQPGTFTGDAQQLTSYSVRLDVVNRRDPRHPTHAARWRAMQDGVAETLSEQGADLSRLVRAEPAFREWLERAAQAIAAASSDERAGVVRQQLGALSTLDLSPATRTAAAAFKDAYEALLGQRASLLALAAHGPIVTLDYTRRRELEAPDLHVLTLVAEAPLWNGQGELVANGSLSLHDRLPAGVTSRVRDAQLGFQLDLPLARARGESRFVLSLGGKYQRLKVDPVAGGEAGNLYLGQAKLTLPLQAGVKVPFSLTVANRTEFIKEREVRANVGFTFDLDAVLAAGR